MNLLHRWYCRSPGWARVMHEHAIPWVLADTDLGDHVLEVGPGPGVTTDWLRERLRKLTTIEIDHKLAESLKTRLDGTNVTVVEGDATAMRLQSDTFSAAVCFTMLHHVPSAQLQNKLFAETFRVLRPGGLFLGSDSTPSFRWRLYHLFDTCVPVPPETLASRLEGAGFHEVTVDTNPWAFRFRARKPAP